MIDVAATLALIDEALCSCVEPLVFGHACRGELLGRELKTDPEVDSPEQLAAYRVFERDLDREWAVVGRPEFQALLVSMRVLVPDRPLVMLATV